MILNGDEYAFLGGVFPKHLELDIKSNSKGPIQYASNIFQWNLISGIETNIGKPLSLINRMFIGSYPKRYRNAWIRDQDFQHIEGARDHNIGFLNVGIIKQFLLNFYTKKYIRKWYKTVKNKRIVLFVYSANFSSCIKYIKHLSSNIHICLILPDLPTYMNMSKRTNALYKLLNFINIRSLNKSIQYTDSFVLLTKQMKNDLNIKNKPIVVMEGLININEVVEDGDDLIVSNSLKKVVYTGTLTKKYGILNLVNAFHEINDNGLQLIICGDGEAKEDIIRLAEKDKRIIYKGVLSPLETRKVQTSATVLVNPRQNIGEYTKYSFPSKTLEYMMSGVPVICYKLDGIPSEYDDYLVYINPENNQGYDNLRNKIIEMCSLNVNNSINIGKRAKEFVLKNKNNVKQAYKVLSGISEGISND